MNIVEFTRNLIAKAIAFHLYVLDREAGKALAASTKAIRQHELAYQAYEGARNAKIAAKADERLAVNAYNAAVKQYG